MKIRSIRSLATLCLAAFAFTFAHAAVDANKASQAELESVKGIGPGLAVKIVDARKAGEFKDWADLVGRVSGIGPGNASRFSQNGLTVNAAPYPATALAADADKPAKRPAKAAKATPDAAASAHPR